MSGGEDRTYERPEAFWIVGEPGHAPCGALVAAYARVAGERFPQWFTERRCINATWVCREVMRRYGVADVATVSVSVQIANREALAFMELHGKLPETSEELGAWSQCGAHLIAVDTSTADDDHGSEYPGHVAVAVQGWLIDAAASQFHRPARGIAMPEVLVIGASGGFLQGSEPILMETDEGALVRYAVRTDDRAYEAAQGFRRTPGNLFAADEIERLLRASGNV